MPPLGRLRTMSVDDHALTRKGLTNMVANNPTIKVVREAANDREAVKQVRYLKPDEALWMFPFRR